MSRLESFIRKNSGKPMTEKSFQPFVKNWMREQRGKVDLFALYLGPQGDDAEWVCRQIEHWMDTQGEYKTVSVIYEGLGVFRHPSLNRLDALPIMRWFIDNFSPEECKHETLRGPYALIQLTCDDCGKTFQGPPKEYEQALCGAMMVYKRRAQNSEKTV